MGWSEFGYVEGAEEGPHQILETLYLFCVLGSVLGLGYGGDFDLSRLIIWDEDDDTVTNHS